MVADAGFGDAFASANPHQTTHRQDLNRLLDRACGALHSSIVRGFETLPVVAAYRNALALAAQDSYLLECLLRTMVQSGDSGLDKIVSALETGLAKRVSGDPGLLWLLDSTALAVGELPK